MFDTNGINPNMAQREQTLGALAKSSGHERNSCPWVGGFNRKWWMEGWDSAPWPEGELVKAFPAGGPLIGG